MSPVSPRVMAALFGVDARTEALARRMRRLVLIGLRRHRAINVRSATNKALLLSALPVCDRCYALAILGGVLKAMEHAGDIRMVSSWYVTVSGIPQRCRVPVWARLASAPERPLLTRRHGPVTNATREWICAHLPLIMPEARI